MKKLLLTIALMLFASLTGFAQSADEKYAEVSRLKTIKERQKWFSSQSPKVKAVVWREHLSRKLENTDLTDEQKAILSELREMITPEFVNFAKGKSAKEMEEFAPVRKSYNELMKRASKLFTPEEAKYLFWVLGDSKTLEKEN